MLLLKLSDFKIQSTLSCSYYLKIVHFVAEKVIEKLKTNVTP